jgi:hypothetical protein
MLKWISDSKLVPAERRIDDSEMIKWEPGKLNLAKNYAKMN